MKKNLVLAIIISICFVFPPAVFASDAPASDASVVAERLTEETNKYSTEPQPDSGSGKTFPSKFDLREKGVVTPVKLQNPYGTCWGFSAIAAAETSILSKSGKTYEETGLDLSEHQVAWFAKTPLSIGSSQDGEGCHVLEGNDPMNIGGWIYTCTSVFSSGIGPSLEQRFPYRGHDGAMDMARYDFLHLLPVSYSASDDWSIEESARFHQDYALQESRILDDPAQKLYDENCENYIYLGYSATATEEIKQELMNGMAVSIAMSADTYLPGQDEGQGTYMSDNWCHYTYDNGSLNHAVTIVGWDDTVPATSFLDHSSDSADGLPHQPEGDGAWIVKNSWGADTNAFPNKNSWGIPDENGNGTGYFYLSYYDHSISIPEVLEFKETINDVGFLIDEYDFMPSEAETPDGWIGDELFRSCNVFTAEADQIIESVSVDTIRKDETVNFEIYLLEDDAVSPVDGQRKAELSCAFAYKGYHRVELEEGVFVKAGQKYSLVATKSMDSPQGTLYEVSCSRAMNELGMMFMNLLLPEDQQLNYYCKGIVNPGESYVYIDSLGKWVDWSEVVAEFQTLDAYVFNDFDNFSLKAYSSFANEEEGLAMVHSLGYTYPEAKYSYEQYVEAGKAYQLNQLLKKLFFVLLIVLIVVIILTIRHRRRKRRKTAELMEQETAEQLKQMDEMTK